MVVRTAQAEGHEMVMAMFPRQHVPEGAASSQPSHRGISGKPREMGSCNFWHKRRHCWPWLALGDAAAVPLVTRHCTNVADQKQRNIWGLLGGRNRPCLITMASQRAQPQRKAEQRWSWCLVV